MKPKIERSPETRARLSEAAKKTWERRHREKEARKRGPAPAVEPESATEEATLPDVLSFGTEVRRLRLAAEMTLADLAERTRLGIPYLSLLERQKTRTPHELRVRAIAKALDAEPEHLLMLASLGHGAPVSHDRYRVVCEQNVVLRKQVETLRAERDAAIARAEGAAAERAAALAAARAEADAAFQQGLIVGQAATCGALSAIAAEVASAGFDETATAIRIAAATLIKADLRLERGPVEGA